MFYLTDWLPLGEGRGEGSFEIERPRSRGWKNFLRRWTKGLGGLENWKLFMDVICVSSITVKWSGIVVLKVSPTDIVVY